MVRRFLAMPRWALGILSIIAFACIYWGFIGALLSDTDADLTLRPSADMLPPGGSVAVALSARLIEDAVEDKGWTPNDSIFRPTAMLEDMPAFQSGQQAMLAAFVAALDAGAGGDPDLADAATALAVPPDRGWLHGEFPFIGASAESHYRDAVSALVRYNRALADSNSSVGDARQLRLAIIAVERALADKATVVDKMVDDSGGDSDSQYQEVRGAAFAATMILRGLREDFDPLVRERQLGALWAESTEALDAVAAHDPFGVGRDDLVEQGYFLLRAGDALRALSAGVGR